MKQLVLFLFLAFFGLDIYSIFLLGDEIGGIAAFALVILDFIIGAKLFSMATQNIRQGTMMHVVSGNFAYFWASLLFIFPGFFSDIIAILICVPILRQFLLLPFLLLVGLLFKLRGMQDVSFSNRRAMEEQFFRAYQQRRQRGFGRWNQDFSESFTEAHYEEEPPREEEPQDRSQPRDAEDATPLEKARSRFQAQRPVVDAHFEEEHEEKKDDK